MTKTLRIAIVASVLIAAGTLIAALVLKPAPDVWSRAEQLRQIIAIGLGTIVLVLAAASVERTAEPSPPPAPSPSPAATPSPSAPSEQP